MKYYFKLFLLGVFIGITALSATQALASKPLKLTVCHKTHSETNPWVKQTINANELQSHLDNGDFLITKDRPCPPVVVTPTVTPTITPTETPIPTPTITPCIVWEGEFPIPCPTETPTITPTPTIEQPQGNGGGSDGGSSDPGATQSHVTTCTSVIQAPLLQGFKAEGNGELTFSWWGVDGADHYSIRYGYSPSELIYGVPNIPSSSTSITLGGLTKGKSVWAIVTVYKQDCARDSNILDPIVK